MANYLQFCALQLLTVLREGTRRVATSPTSQNNQGAPHFSRPLREVGAAGKDGMTATVLMRTACLGAGFGEGPDFRRAVRET
jgi:hypothetical protein